MFSAIMYMPFFIQGVMGTSASKSGFVMMFMTLSMVFSSTITGQVVTRTGNIKSWPWPGTGRHGHRNVPPQCHGYRHLQPDGRSQPYHRRTWSGNGFSIFNLTVQNAVSHSNLGVATASIQLFRQMGGTVGVSVMGSIMSYRMETKLAVGETTPPANTFSGLTDKLKGLDPPNSSLPGTVGTLALSDSAGDERNI